LDLVKELLSRMYTSQLSDVSTFLHSLLRTDFISELPLQGFDHIAEKILSFLDVESLHAAQLVSREWNRVISGNFCSLYKGLLEEKVRSDPLWRQVAERKKWIKHLYTNKKQSPMNRNDRFYRQLYFTTTKVFDFNFLFYFIYNNAHSHRTLRR
jgi:F-box and WD-40 domain protein 1/11